MEKVNLLLPKEYETSLEEKFKNILESSIDEINRSSRREFITLAEAKEYTGTTYATIRKWSERGLKSYQIDAKIYYSINEINDFIRQHQI